MTGTAGCAAPNCGAWWPLVPAAGARDPHPVTRARPYCRDSWHSGVVPLLIVALVGLALVLPIVLLPVSIIQRYRVGTARRPARAWVATLNIVGFTVSTAMILVTATITALWVPNALPVTAAALLAGGLIGMLGLTLSRWESQAGVMFFTPNRWLVLALTLLVLARLAWGGWRAWQAWSLWGGQAGWLSQAGVSGSLAAGALLVGYGLGFWAGVRWRIARRRAARLSYI